MPLRVTGVLHEEASDGRDGSGGCGTAAVRRHGERGPDPDPVGVAVDSPGVLSGNVVQIPIDLDLNVCGNSINEIGLLNPALGNHCES